MGRGPRTKAAIKRLAKQCVMVRGRWWRASGVRILTYHSVGSREHEMNVKPDDFHAQMEWLATHARVISLGDAVHAQEGIAITFDDGYRDNLTHAAPILNALGLPATFFIVAGRVGGVLNHDRDPQTGALMTWDEILQLASMGFQIGCHTLTHPLLSTLAEPQQRAEIFESAQRLRDHVGSAIEAFAYPFGSASDYDAVSMQLVREAGFSYAVSNRYGVNGPDRDRWALRRLWIDATDDLAMFRAKVDGRLDALALLDSRIGMRVRRALNRFL